jgi:hypothetical protein
MQTNEGTQGAMPSLNDIISSDNPQEPNQVSYSKVNTVQTVQPGIQSSYSYTRTVQEEGNLPSQTKVTTTTTNTREQPNQTTQITRKVVTSQQPTTTESTYYSKKITTKTTTTNGPSNQTNSRYNAGSSSNRNQTTTSSYTRPGAQTKTTTTTTTTTTSQRGQYGQNNTPSSQVYRGNQRTQMPQTKISSSQSYAGNKNQPRRPQPSTSYKPKARSPEPGSMKRKTINRGNPVENVQITHIIFTSEPADFHIIEKLNLENLETAPIQISKSDRARLQRSGKVTSTCSCDGVEIAKPKKVNLKGKTIHYQHARGIGMTNDRKENINPMFYSSEIKKLEPINRQKDGEKLENVEVFRSEGKVYNNYPKETKTSTTTKTTTTYNRGSNYTQNQNYRGGATSNTVNRGATGNSMTGRGGMATSMSGRGGMTSSSANNRGGMGTSVKTTTTYTRGSNMGSGRDGEIIKETNTKVQMGSRSYKNTSQPITTTTSERKVYTQKNFFNNK